MNQRRIREVLCFTNLRHIAQNTAVDGSSTKQDVEYYSRESGALVMRSSCYS